MTAYYNEIEPYAAQWLRNLIIARHIADGEVDTRSIVDVRPADLAGYTQCHFFAGIGGWSLAPVGAGDGLVSEVIRSVYADQSDILKGIMRLHCPDGFDADISYGNGQFYKNIPPPRLKFDIDPQNADVTRASSDALPLADASVRNLVFDPPFLTYVRQGRTGNGAMAMAKRFGGYWRYDELKAHYVGTLKEARRVLTPKGVLVFKCQDIIHNHRMHCTHANVITWGADAGFRLLDLFVLPAAKRMPSPNRAGAQKHARIFHSYFLVLQC